MTIRSDYPNSQAHDEARCAVSRGWRVFPLVEGEGPFAATRGHFEEAYDPAKFDCLASRYPNSNWTVCTGTDSKIVVLDLEYRFGSFSTMKELVAKYGPLPSTATAQTPRGGTVLTSLYRSFPKEMLATSNQLHGLPCIEVIEAQNRRTPLRHEAHDANIRVFRRGSRACSVLVPLPCVFESSAPRARALEMS
jgi:hypothetical protein